MAPVCLRLGFLSFSLSFSLALPLSSLAASAAWGCPGDGRFTSGDSASSPALGKTAVGGRLNRKSRTISACCSLVTPCGPGTLFHGGVSEMKGSPSTGQRDASLGRSLVAQKGVIL